jgi:hypothetical protein
MMEKQNQMIHRWLTWLAAGGLSDNNVAGRAIVAHPGIVGGQGQRHEGKKWTEEKNKRNIVASPASSCSWMPRLGWLTEEQNRANHWATMGLGEVERRERKNEANATAIVARLAFSRRAERMQR